MADASAWIVFVNLWPLPLPLSDPLPTSNPLSDPLSDPLTHALMSTAFHCAQNSFDPNSIPASTTPQEPKSRRSAL